MKLLLLFTTFAFFNKAHTLTETEEISLNNIAWLFAQFSLTFDPAEITTSEPTLTPSESLVPLYTYFKSNSEMFDNFKTVQTFFEITHLQKIVTSVSSNELQRLLEERVTIHQNQIVTEDKTPLKFFEFYAIFRIIQGVVETEYHDSNIPKITNIMTVPQSHPLMQLFCHARSSNDKEVIKSLKKFQLREELQKNKKMEGKEMKMLTLSNAFTEQLKGVKEPKPIKWTIHHMIPSTTIVDFYNNYFRLLSQKSFEMTKHKRFDWIKINEIFVQKTFLANAETLWINSDKDGNKPTVPVYNYDKNENSGQEDFVRAWYRWPLGLLFYGPHESIRNDDPSKDKNKPLNKRLYNNQPNHFEAFAAAIVSDEYFEKVKKLNTEILKFNKLYLNTDDITILNERAMKIYKRLLTIHREAPWANKVIVPFNTDGWIFESIVPGRWDIRQEFRPTFEWGIKALAQQFNMMLMTNDVGVSSGASTSKELRRRRRHHIEEIKCEPHTQSEAPENGFWCSPFYLRLNPMNYIYCRLSGHKNLKFFT
jgi:hypothetical protein